MYSKSQYFKQNCLVLWTLNYRGSTVLLLLLLLLPPASGAQLDARPTGDQEVAGSTPRRVGNILSWRFDHEVFSTVILSLPLIQERQLSVSGERMSTILVNRSKD